MPSGSASVLTFKLPPSGDDRLERRTHEEIAQELRLSRNTVKTHVSNVLKKLRLGSRREILSPAHPGGRRKIIPLE
jgi:DNA-directed RNA polymerase sigma subunit (sigma70/sigma32)